MVCAAWSTGGNTHACPAIDGHPTLDTETGVHEPALEGRVWWAVVVVDRGFWNPGEVEKVDTEEGDDEAGQQGYGVGGVIGVEALEQDDGGYEGGCRKSNVIHGIHTVV